MNNQTDPLFLNDPFVFNTKMSDLFLDSFRKTALCHYEKNTFFKFLWDKNNMHPFDVKTEEDIERIPFILVDLFKEKELLTGPREDVVLTLGSSGTSGQRSLIHLDARSLDQVKKLAYKVYESLGITSKKKYNYLCFTYDPNIANDLGTAFTDELLTSFTGKEDVFYTFKHNGTDFYYDEEATLEKLKEFEKSSLSTRILGFPAFLYELMEKYSFTIDLGEDSWLQTGGGWKSKANKEIPKADFRKLCKDRLGIPIENNRDLFGMVEHGIPYVDDENGRLRIPNYSRVMIRDPKTLKILDYGQKGLIQFVCTYNTSYPAMSLLTTDYGIKRKDHDGEYLEILGRVPSIKSKSCALKAMEML